MIRKIIIGKEPTQNAMVYEVGKLAVQRQYIIDSIILREDNSKDIFIRPSKGDKTDEIIIWKTIHSDMPCIVEYSQSFG